MQYCMLFTSTLNWTGIQYFSWILGTQILAIHFINEKTRIQRCSNFLRGLQLKKKKSEKMLFLQKSRIDILTARDFKKKKKSMCDCGAIKKWENAMPYKRVEQKYCLQEISNRKSPRVTTDHHWKENRQGNHDLSINSEHGAILTGHSHFIIEY